MTTTAVILPNNMAANLTQGGEESARSSITPRQNTQGSHKADRQAINHSDTDNPELSNTLLSSDTSPATTDRGGKFVEVLKKHLKKNDSVDESPKKIPSDVQNQQAVVIESISSEIAPIHSQSAAVLAFKNVPAPRNHNHKTASTQTATSNITSENVKAVNTPLMQTAANRSDTNNNPKRETAFVKPEQSANAEVKTPIKMDAPGPDKIETTEKNALNPQNTPTHKNAETAPSKSVLTTETTLKAVETPNIADTLPHKRIFSKILESGPNLMSSAPKNKFALQNHTANQESASSLKNGNSFKPKQKTDKQLVTESGADDPKNPQTIDLKEQKSAASQNTKAVGPLESPVNAALGPVQTATQTTQIDTSKGLPDTAAARPVDQIVQTLQLRTFGAESQIRMTLSPEDLGSIRITFRQIDNEMVGLLEVQKSDTRKEIERSVSQLTAAMESTGLQVRRIEVVPWNNSNNNNAQNPRGEQFGQEYDARNHQEMYRFSDEETLQRQYRKEFTDETKDSQSTIAVTQNGPLNPSEAGLNFFI